MPPYDTLGRLYVAGQWRPASQIADDVNPYSGASLLDVAQSTAADVDLAYQAARDAQGEWIAGAPWPAASRRA